MNDKTNMNDSKTKAGAETRPFEALVICTGQPRIELYNEDWRDVLPRYEENAFDLAIVDPPYGIDIAGNGGSVGKYGANHDAKKWDIEKPTPMYFEELKRVSKNQIIWGANYIYPQTGPGWIVWDKIQPAPNFADCELAWTSFEISTRIFKYCFNKEKNKIHPTQKPVALYRWLLQNYAEEGDKILDTHLGSGSSAIACYEEKFDLVATEIDTDYFEAMTKRFNQHKRQGKLF